MTFHEIPKKGQNRPTLFGYPPTGGAPWGALLKSLYLSFVLVCSLILTQQLQGEGGVGVVAADSLERCQSLLPHIHKLQHWHSLQNNSSVLVFVRLVAAARHPQTPALAQPAKQQFSPGIFTISRCRETSQSTNSNSGTGIACK